MKFTKLAPDTFKKLQLNAGIIVNEFNPADDTIGDVLLSTSGGIKVDFVPTTKDFGEDIDNCPKGSKELMQIERWECKASGTGVTVDTASAKSFIGACDVSGNKLTPRDHYKDEDFDDLWIIGDYSDINDDEDSKKAGYVAIHMMNAISTGGFSMQTADKEKGKFAFEYKACYSLEDISKVPFEIYIKAGA